MARKQVPAWTVTVEEHTVAGRWRIDGQVLEVFAVDAVAARVEATRILHVRHAVAPWKPWARYSFLRTSAAPVREQSRVGGGS
jgi:hypothetical protein